MKKNNLRGIHCRQHPITYINMPKSACTTIKNLMYSMDTGKPYPDPVAIHADRNCLLKGKTESPEYLEAEKRSKLYFTFVRHPFSRCYSAFNEKIFHQSKYSFPRYRSALVEQYGAAFPREGVNYTAEQHAENFYKFIKMVSDIESGRSDLKVNFHWKPQARILRPWKLHKTIDFVGRVENFKDGMRYVLAISGCTKPIDLDVKFNEGPPAPFAYKEIETPSIRQILEEVYEDDLVTFHYG